MMTLRFMGGKNRVEDATSGIPGLAVAQAGTIPSMLAQCAVCGCPALAEPEQDHLVFCPDCGAPRDGDLPLGDQVEVGLFGYVWKAPHRAKVS